MKKVILTAVVALIVSVFGEVKAQDFKIYNGASCPIQFYVNAAAPFCSTSFSTNTYTLAPGSVMYFDMVTPSQWSGGVLPTPGSAWSFAKMGALAGPYSGGTNLCTNPISNINVVVVGNGSCTPFPMATCVDYTACNPTKVFWTQSGVDAKVEMYD